LREISLFQISGRRKCDPDRMKTAVTAIRKNRNEEFKDFQRSTLERCAKLESNFANSNETKLDRKAVLLPSLEEDAVEHSLHIGKCCFGLTMHA
jgi:hypothetical protein